MELDGRDHRRSEHYESFLRRKVDSTDESAENFLRSSFFFFFNLARIFFLERPTGYSDFSRTLYVNCPLRRSEAS